MMESMKEATVEDAVSLFNMMKTYEQNLNGGNPATSFQCHEAETNKDINNLNEEPSTSKHIPDYKNDGNFKTSTATDDSSNTSLLETNYESTSTFYPSVLTALAKVVETGEITELNETDTEQLPAAPRKRKRQRVKKKRKRKRKTNRVEEFIKNSKQWEEVRKMEKIWAKMRANRCYTVYELKTNTLPAIVVKPKEGEETDDDVPEEKLRDIFIEMGALKEPVFQEIDTSPETVAQDKRDLEDFVRKKLSICAEIVRQEERKTFCDWNAMKCAKIQDYVRGRLRRFQGRRRIASMNIQRMEREIIVLTKGTNF